MIRPAALAAALGLLAQPALAILPEEEAPPPPSPTSITCADGHVWDAGRGRCVPAQESALPDADLLRAARELAHAGRFDSAIRVLAALDDPDDDLALTILGFAHRKAGRTAEGMAFYDRALALNPDNVMARSYRGMALVEMGDLEGARTELARIEEIAGPRVWAAEALSLALRKGAGVVY